jgi:hypothetical protein
VLRNPAPHDVPQHRWGGAGGNGGAYGVRALDYLVTSCTILYYLVKSCNIL